MQSSTATFFCFFFFNLSNMTPQRRCHPIKPTISRRSFRGVRRRSWGRYVSEIRLPGKNTRVWLGSFASPEMAARAYDSAAAFLRGNSAVLNFPDSAHSLPRPNSCSRRDIQSAAAMAALQMQEKKSGVLEDRGGGVFWWECEMDERTSFERVKEAPLLSPLRLSSVTGDLSFSHEDFWFFPSYFQL